MTYLRTDANFLLPYGRLVEAKVQAFNRNGWSTISDPNTSGTTIKTEPLIMTTVTKGSATSQSQI